MVNQGTEDKQRIRHQSSSPGDISTLNFKRSSDISLEFRKTASIIDYARQNGGEIRVRGQTLDGQSVELRLDPAKFGESRTADYGKPTN